MLSELEYPLRRWGLLCTQHRNHTDTDKIPDFKDPGSSSIRQRSDTFTPDRYQIDDSSKASAHDGVIKWKYFPRYWPFVRGINRSPVDSLHNGQWRGALMFSLICVWINGWVNNREAGDLRRYRAHHDVTVMYHLSIDPPYEILLSPLLCIHRKTLANNLVGPPLPDVISRVLSVPLLCSWPFRWNWRVMHNITNHCGV